MKLQLRPAGDGRTMYLTDEEGRVLPGQRAVIWSHGDAGEIAHAVVTFGIDGDRVSVVDDPIETGNGTLPAALEAFGRLSDANKLRFIEAARPHPLHRSFERLGRALDDLGAALRA